jgi:hypothetical protein
VERPAARVILGGCQDDGLRILEANDDSRRADTTAEIERFVVAAVRRLTHIDVDDGTSREHGRLGEENVVVDDESRGHFDEPPFRIAVEASGKHGTPECGENREERADDHPGDRSTDEEDRSH